MLDDVAGNVLAVLMYIGASHDLLKCCGKGVGEAGGGGVFNHISETPSIKVKRQNRQLGDAVPEELKQWRGQLSVRGM